jgi:hypothetical protein
MKITAYMISCPGREEIRNQTLSDLKETDWNNLCRIERDRTTFDDRRERQVHTASRLLKRALSDRSELILFLEDDLRFNTYLRHNLEHWWPLTNVQSGDYFFGSIYNPNVCELERNNSHAFFKADPGCVYGSQAFILSIATARHIVANWEKMIGMQDIRMSRLAAEMSPIYYHVPSLVQHVGFTSAWGGSYHCAIDFNATWKAS